MCAFKYSQWNARTRVISALKLSIVFFTCCGHFFCSSCCLVVWNGWAKQWQTLWGKCNGKKEKKKQENEKLTNPTPCIAFGPCFIFFVYCLFRSLQLTNYTMLEVELDEIVNDRDLSNRHITTFFRRCFFCCFNNGKLLTNYTTLSRLLFLSTLKSVLLHTHT